MRARSVCWIVLLSGLMLLGIGSAGAQSGAGPTPPRLSLVDGEVSFWRPGADGWSTAQLNTPLAAGDELYADEDANLELQIGNRAFVRAGERSQIGIVELEEHRLRFSVGEGQASFDLRSLPPGLTIEVETPDGLFTVKHSGYYRLTVDDDTTTFSTRRGGRATVVPRGGKALAIAPSEQLVIESDDESSEVESYAVPELDDWDEWNYARTDQLVDALSARYLPPDVYGAEALDRHGSWRVDASYGAVWIPTGMAPGWAPYRDGRWIWDRYYGWTWIDEAPWGWAPFHYGRWVHLGGYWAWAPGPVAVRSAYSPALVAFFGAGGASVSVSVGVPLMSWVALSWGEPLVPWWGRRGFIGVPWWGGWHGPRVVHSVREPRRYRNVAVTQAVVTVPRERFGHGPVRRERVAHDPRRSLSPVLGALPVKPAASSLMVGEATAIRPPRPRESVRETRSDSRREARASGGAKPDPRPPWRVERSRGEEKVRPLERPASKAVQAATPAVKAVPAPLGVRGGAERATPAEPVRFGDVRRAPAAERNDARRNAAGRDPRSPQGVVPEAGRRANPASGERERNQPRPEVKAGASSPPVLRQAPGQPPATAAVPVPPPKAAAPAAPSREVLRQDVREERAERRDSRSVESSRREARAEPANSLPGQPANRVWPRRQGGPDGGDGKDEKDKKPERGGRGER